MVALGCLVAWLGVLAIVIGLFVWSMRPYDVK